MEHSCGRCDMCYTKEKFAFKMPLGCPHSSVWVWIRLKSQVNLGFWLQNFLGPLTCKCAPSSQTYITHHGKIRGNVPTESPRSVSRGGEGCQARAGNRQVTRSDQRLRQALLLLRKFLISFLFFFFLKQWVLLRYNTHLCNSFTYSVQLNRLGYPTLFENCA